MEINFRRAQIPDIDFLIEAIFNAEMSGTRILPLSKIFELNPVELSALLKSILEEEIEGCEFSLSSFIIAELNGRKAATVAGWLEGVNESGLPSALIKANLLSYFLTKEKKEKAALNTSLVADALIDRKPGTYQIEYVYVNPEFRGHNLAARTIEEHLKQAGKAHKAEVQVFADNMYAVKIYEKMGFQKAGIYECKNTDALNFLPGSTKLLMTKNLQNG